jgi:hypothetical protein
MPSRTNQRRDPPDAPLLEAIPSEALDGEPILLRGSGWVDRDVRITL